MLVTMREVQVAQERYGDYRKDVQQWQLVRGVTPAKPTIGQMLRNTVAWGSQWLRVQGRTATPAAGISGSSH